MNRTIGRSVFGEPLHAFFFPETSQSPVLVLAGIHGDEPKSVTVATRLREALSSDRSQAVGEAHWIVVPVANPDGYALRRRGNANRVDINRNFPTENWERSSKRSRMFGGDEPASEPETKALIGLIEQTQPVAIISIHSIDQHRHCNNYDGPAEELAHAMAAANAYPVRGSIGYPTPGSLGTWAGIERGIPVVTLELPSHHSPKKCWQDNHGALYACAEFSSRHQKSSCHMP
ncbi:MAG: M14 family murein peptide amidase A [Phycisphaerae bacterium]|jgi:protein MpaA